MMAGGVERALGRWAGAVEGLVCKSGPEERVRVRLVASCLGQGPRRGVSAYLPDTGFLSSQIHKNSHRGLGGRR